MFLDKILERKQEEVTKKRLERPWHSLSSEISGDTFERKNFSLAIKRSGPAIITEIKRASPSKGVFAPELIAEKIAAVYEENGASAISVLTDQQFFCGDLSDLKSVRAITDLPLLRKDFIIDPYQILEAKWAGADVILLIMAALSPARASELRACARELGLEVLAEVHNEDEVESALAMKPDVIGVNNRDLRTFTVSLEVTKRLRSIIPCEQLVISESGIKDRRDIVDLFEIGIDGFLIGETLVRSKEPGRTLRELIGEREDDWD